MFHFHLRNAVLLGVVLASPVLMSGSTAAAPTDAQKCMSAKLKALSKYELCIWKVRAIAALQGATADTGLCQSKFDTAWDKPDAKYGEDCPDATSLAIQALAASHVQDVVAALSDPEALCGNGLIDDVEACDGANLNGAVCGTGFIGGTPSCSPTCTVDYSSCTQCDLLAQDCGSGNGCYFLGDNICAAAGAVAEGGACAYVNSCEAGYQCVNDPTAVCRQFCSLASPACGVARTCVAIDGAGPDAGVCVAI